MKSTGLLLRASPFVIAATVCFGGAHAAHAQDANDRIEEIIVTAQRREESLQDVPVAVTAVSSEQLSALRITSPRDIAGLAPGLQIVGQGMQSSQAINIRGISSGVSSNSVDPKVGIYIDGVYLGRATGSLLDLGDIQRLEVLRGPQGTLFGRNATSGAISVVTAPPKGEWGVKATGSYGNYNAIRGKVSLDLPQFGPFSLRLSYLHDEIRGDMRNLVAGDTIDLSQRDPAFGTLRYANRLGGRNIDGGQIAIRGEFGNLTADYRFDYTDTRSVGRGLQNLGVIPDASGQLLAPIMALQPFLGGIDNYAPNARLDAVASASSVEHNVTYGHSLTLEMRASDRFTVKSITAYRKFRQDPMIFDLAAAGGLRFTFNQLGILLTPGLTPAQIQAGLFDPANLPGPTDYFFPLLSARAIKQSQFSQELQFQLQTDLFDLTAGLFYFHEKSPATEVLGILEPIPSGTVVASPFDAIFGSGLTRTSAVNDSMAGYAQATFHVSDTLDIIGGLRGTIDDRNLDILAISNAQGGALGVGKYSVSYNKLTYTAIANWRPAPEYTFYAKVATGYVSGGILSGIPYKPETLISYEIGAKTQFLDNRARLNMAAFYNDYQDLQTQNFINGQQFFENAGKAKIKGFETELNFVPVAGLQLSGNISYTDFNYKEFMLAGQDVSAVARPPYFSKWTGRAAAEYSSPDIGGGAYLTGLVEARYRSSSHLTATPIVDVTTGQPALEAENNLPGYWLVNGRLGVADIPLGGTKIALSLFGQNLLDKNYMTYGLPVLLLTGAYERGRTYGVEVGFSF